MLIKRINEYHLKKGESKPNWQCLLHTQLIQRSKRSFSWSVAPHRPDKHLQPVCLSLAYARTAVVGEEKKKEGETVSRYNKSQVGISGTRKYTHTHTYVSVGVRANTCTSFWRVGSGQLAESSPESPVDRISHSNLFWSLRRLSNTSFGSHLLPPFSFFFPGYFSH